MQHAYREYQARKTLLGNVGERAKGKRPVIGRKDQKRQQFPQILNRITGKAFEIFIGLFVDRNDDQLKDRHNNQYPEGYVGKDAEAEHIEAALPKRHVAACIRSGFGIARTGIARIAAAVI